MLTAQQLGRVKELMGTVHSFAGLIEKIEQAAAKPGNDEELERLQLQLSLGLDAACELAKSLNQTALALHLEILTRRKT